MPAQQDPNRYVSNERGESADGEVVVDLHGWRLDGSPLQREALARHLCRDEMRRAHSFVFARDRDRFLAARGRLREILAGCLGADPRELIFDYGEQGKPRLAGAGAALRFNLSHSGDHAVLAVSRSAEVGVDIECVRPIERELAARTFSAAEVAALDALPDERWLEGFFRCWTRKEAVVKAIGTGLLSDLAAFDVSVAPDEPRLLRFDGDPDAPLHWSLFEPRPAAGLIVAVAVRAEARRVRLRCGHELPVSQGHPSGSERARA
jgi:4'-phosphopantetheinyl transferase